MAAEERSQKTTTTTNFWVSNYKYYVFTSISPELGYLSYGFDVDCCCGICLSIHLHLLVESVEVVSSVAQEVIAKTDFYILPPSKYVRYYNDVRVRFCIQSLWNALKKG